MATTKEFINFVVEQIESTGKIEYRKMFGEYVIYYNKKVVALVCDNQVFIKPTNAGKAYIGKVIEAPAYPGAKPSFLIKDQFEDRKWFSELIRITADELPEPKPKKKKIKK
jgi:TfoX/Sxy family transcriptional regulator of competence genes